MKHFNDEKFVNELLNQQRERVYFLAMIRMLCGEYGKNYF